VRILRAWHPRRERRVCGDQLLQSRLRSGLTLVVT
jgi:hypothetical protein